MTAEPQPDDAREEFVGVESVEDDRTSAKLIAELTSLAAPRSYPAPPVLTAAQILPFGDLRWDVFEQLCFRLASSKDEVVHAQRYGVKGQRQDGIDLYARREDAKYLTYQCKLYESLTAANISAAVSRFLEGRWASRSEQFVFCTNQSLVPTRLANAVEAAAERLKKQSPPVEFVVWDQEQLSILLKERPSLVRDFFGPSWYERFCPWEASESTNAQLAAIHERLQAKQFEIPADRLVGDLTDKLDRVVDAFERSAERPASPGLQVSEASSLIDVIDGSLPPDIVKIVQDLKATDPREATAILVHIRADLSRVSELVTDPPSWIGAGSATVWDAVGLLCGAVGRWSEAETAYMRAEQLPGADRVRTIMRARHAALAQGETDSADRLLERARGLDPDSFHVRLAEVQLCEDPHEQLRQLEGLLPSTDRERATFGVTLAQTFARLERYEEAYGAATDVVARDPGHLEALDCGAEILLRRERVAMGLGRDVDRAALRSAAEISLRLRRQLHERGRTGTAVLLSRAIHAYVIADEFTAAQALVRTEPISEERASGRGRRALADAALNARMPEHALELLGDRSQWETDDRALAAQALAFSKESEEVRQGFEIARELFDEDEARELAAFAMVAAAMGDADLVWRDDALAVVAEQMPALAAHMHAQRLVLEGADEEAERVLLPFSRDIMALRALVDRALALEDWTKALALSDRLVSSSGRAEDRLRRAHALRELGSRERLLAELRAIADAEDQPRELRVRAFAALSDEVAPQDYAGLAQLADDWLQVAPDDGNAFWLRLFAYMRLARHDDALRALQARPEPPRTPQQAWIAATIYMRSLSPLVAAESIAKLADEFDPRDERLEAMIIFAAVRTDEMAGPPLRDRIGEAYAYFDALPKSSMIRFIRADSPEDLVQMMRDQLAAAEPAIFALERKLADGEIPVALLASQIGRDLVQFSARAPVLYCGYSDPALDEEELDAARRAVAGGAVWDPLALAVICSFDVAVREALVAALPGSAVAATTLAECDRAVGRLDERREQVIFGSRSTETIAGDEVAKERSLANAALDIAKTMVCVSDVDPSEPSHLDELLDDEDIPLSTRTWLGTANIAMRRGMPICSDDRFVRVACRPDGVECFGIAALLAATCEKGLLTEAQVQEARRAMLRRGAYGLRPAGTEIADIARDADWEPVPGLRQVLLDHFAWRQDCGSHLRRLTDFLAVVHAERPDRLGAWVARVLSCAAVAVPRLDLEFVAAGLLMQVWAFCDRDVNARSFGLAAFHAIDEAPLLLGRPPFQGLAVGAMDLALAAFATEVPEVRAAVFLKFVRQLPWKPQLEVILTFVSGS